MSDAQEIEIEIGRGLPRIKVLRPVDQEKLLARALSDGTEALPDKGTPYYAEIWPAAVPLARWILEERVCKPGARVLELGCGLGVVGIAIAKGTGARVTLTDGSPDALELCRQSIARNAPFENEPTVARLDWREPEPAIEALGGRFPIVIGADVLYEPASFEALARAASAALRDEGTLYLAEPERPVARSAASFLRDAGLEQEERARTREGVVVQVWTRSGQKNRKGPRCG